MFATGDAVMHPAHGAGIVVEIKSMPIQHITQQYYMINILGKTKMMIMVPVDNAGKLGMRLAITSAEIDQVWQVLSATPDELPDDNKQRFKELTDKLKIPETFKVAEVVRDLKWRRVQTERLNSSGQRLYDRAMHLLAGEIAVSQDVKMQSAKLHIEEFLDVNMSRDLKK